MKILRLELFGFKSFKDKTIVTFDQPITGIIGSNGCGKSNVVDALYWVMGDMSPKHLRGSVMTDVIFSGSRDAAAMDMAEVTMVLERNPGVDPELPPQFQASTEIQITRRYYRNGESEYLINKVICRLRDIQEFFMDTGVGAKAYSIVEQGAIARMINLKPEDRRVVIEEVAGIMKFKARRAETERKIEHSKTNLQRVDDIVQDLQKQLTSLKRQADKAEKFKVLSDELKNLELRLATREWVERSSSKNTSLSLIEEYRSKLNELETRLLSQRETFELAQTELTQLEGDLHVRRENTRRIELALKDLESEATNLKTKQESLGHRIESNKSSIDEITSRSLVLDAELVDVGDKIALLNQKSETLALELEGAEAEAEIFTKRVEDIRAHLTTQRKQLHQEEIEQTRHTQQIQNYQRSLASLETKKNQISSQLEYLASEIDLRDAERQSTLTSLEAAFATRSELEGAKLNLDEELATLDNRRTETNAKRDLIKEELQVVRIRKEQLESLERDLDGVDSAAKALALHMRETGFEHPLLADAIKVPALLEKATEAVLGRNLQRVIASDIDSVSELRNVLAQSLDSEVKNARAPLWIPGLASESARAQANLDQIYLSVPAVVTPALVGSNLAVNNGFEAAPLFLNEADIEANLAAGFHRPSDVMHSYHLSEEIPGPDGLVATQITRTITEPTTRVITAREYLAEHADVIGPLDKLISSEMSPSDQENAPWLALLSDFWVVRSRESLLQLAKDFEKLPLNFVSLDGDVLHRNGFLDLAPVEAGQDEQASGLIQRKRIIADLISKEEVLSADLTTAQNEFDACLFALSQAKEKFRELTSQLAALNPDVEKHSVFLRQVEAQLARLSEKKDLLSAELTRAIEESHEITLKLEEVTAELSHAELRKDQILEQLGQTEADLEILQSQSQQHASKVSELRTQVKQSDREIADMQTKRASSEQERNILKAREAQLSEEITRFEVQVVELNAAVEDNSIRHAANLGELRQSQDTENELSDTVSRAKSALRTLQQDVEKLGQDSIQLSNQVRDLEQGVAIHEVEMRNLSEKVQNQYQMSLAELDAEKIAELTAASDLEELADPEAGKRHATHLRTKIDNLGKINMVAIEEFEELRKRHEYLFIQREDLSDAIRQLQEAIERIDRESKERFGEAFHAVNDAFQKTFPLLFGGGQAELRMTNPDNLLETGVEIIAQPPGKKLQSVTLLSGGEKALTAVSLIFGIFSIKPSPFCVLDEVDAPLDDANVGRFCNLVRKITQASQVIMITHHKKTMEHADALFGVTMEKPGISKLASVKLGELHHEDFIK